MLFQVRYVIDAVTFKTPWPHEVRLGDLADIKHPGKHMQLPVLGIEQFRTHRSERLNHLVALTKFDDQEESWEYVTNALFVHRVAGTITSESVKYGTLFFHTAYARPFIMLEGEKVAYVPKTDDAEDELRQLWTARFFERVER